MVLKADDLKEAYVVVAGFMELLSYNCKATLANNKDCAQVPYLDMVFAPHLTGIDSILNSLIPTTCYNCAATGLGCKDHS